MTQGDTYVGIRRTFDENGNTISEITCDAEGQPIARNAGYDEARYTYNEKNQAIKIEYLLEGNPVVMNDGVSIIEREYDDNGWVAIESYYGINGEPVLQNNRYHRIEREYLDARHVTKETWFDTEGKPTTTGDTYCER